MGPDRWIEVCRLAEGQLGVVGKADLIALGFDPDACRYLVRRRLLLRRGTGAYVVAGSAGGWRQELLAAQVDTGGVVSHRAAAALWELDALPSGFVELSVPKGRRLDRPRLLLHVATDLEAHTVTNGPFRVTSPARTLVDLAGLVGRQRLEHAVDGALRDRLTTADELRACLEARAAKGRPGIPALRALLVDQSAGTPESVLERRFLRLLAAHGLPMPRLQVVHPATDDRPEIRVDAQWDAARLVVELDGHGAHATRRQRGHDAERANRLRLEGFNVLCFTYEHVTHRPGYVVATVTEALGRF